MEKLERKLIKRIDMALHVQELCAKHKITVEYQSLNETTPRYMANPNAKRIRIRPTKNTGYYVSALHEIGHVVWQNRNKLINGAYTYDFHTESNDDEDVISSYTANANSRIQCELQAWIYAFSNALTWTATAERIMRRAMDSYGWKQTHKDLWSQITGIPIEEGEIVIAEEVNILQQSISHEKETAKGILAYG